MKLFLLSFIASALLMGCVVLFFSRNNTTVLGDKITAEKVNLIVFSDFECPACANVEPLLKQAQAKFADQINYQFRHFPLTSIHPYAMVTAKASEAAREQNKFWEMHDLLFAQQKEWSDLKSEAAVKNQLLMYAQNLGLDVEKFTTDLENEAIANRVLTDVSDANKLGLNSTPSIFINQQKTAPQDLIKNLERSL